LEDVDKLFDSLIARDTLEILKPTKTPSFMTEDAFQLAEKSMKDHSSHIMTRQELVAARTAPTTEKKPHRGSVFCQSNDNDLV
jgi:hypothetical protein